MTILAQQYPIYQPAMRVVSTIVSSDALTIVTTTFAHQYNTGAIVRLNIPLGFGMKEINQQYAPIIVLSSTTFSMPINSSEFSLFTVPTSYPNNRQSATVTPVGEINPLLNSSVQNVLPYSAT